MGSSAKLEPNERLSDYVRRIFAPDPAWTYGSMLPWAENKATGEETWALSDNMRNALYGLADLVQGPEYGQNLTPEAVSQIFGPGPSGAKGIVIGPGARIFQQFSKTEPVHNVPWDPIPRINITDRFMNRKALDKKINELAMTDKAETHELGDLISHSGLFAAYPELQKYSVSMDPKLPGLGRSLSTHMELNPTELVKSGVDPGGVALHELMHTIQQKEGMALGGSPSQFVDPDVPALYSLFQNNPEYLNDRLGFMDQITLADELRQMHDKSFDMYNRMGGEYEAMSVENLYNAQRRGEKSSLYPDLPSPYSYGPFPIENVHTSTDPMPLTPEMKRLLELLRP